MPRKLRLFTAPGPFCLWAFASACAPELRLRSDAPPLQAAVVTERLGEAVALTHVDASDYDCWVALNLATETQVAGPEPSCDLPDTASADAGLQSPAPPVGTAGSLDRPGSVGKASTVSEGTWDLAFQRFHILTNGGASGPGDAAVAVVEGLELAEVAAIPDTGFEPDAPDSDDSDTVNDSVFNRDDGWYDYASADNRLTPKRRVYVLRAASGGFYKLQLSGYYNGSGSSGHPSFLWAALAPGD